MTEHDGHTTHAPQRAGDAGADRMRSASQRRRLTILLALNVAMIIGLVVVGVPEPLP